MDNNCAVYKASNLIGKRWTLMIMLEIFKGEEKWKRYNQIKSKLPTLTPKMLSARLKELEKYGIIQKRVDATVMPIKSEYSLTRHGEDFMKIIHQIRDWSIKSLDSKPCKSKECKNCEL